MKRNLPESRRSATQDWQAIHRRLEQVQASLEGRTVLDREAQKKILRERAKKWARDPAQVSTEEDDLEVVAFSLAYETYAVETRYVREVYSMREYTPLPGTPSFVLGIVNIRGRIVSVLDIKKFFDFPEKGLTDLNKIILLQHNAMEFGILADSIHGLRRIRQGSLQTALPTLTGIRADYLRGVTSERTVVLDAERLLSHPQILIYDEGNFGS